MKLNIVAAIAVAVMLLLSSLMGVSPAFAQTSGSQKYLAIYYEVYTSGSSYVTAGGSTYNIGGSGGAMFCYTPALNTTTLVSKYVSFSYSPMTVVPYTVDDRLFLITEFLPQGGGSSGGASASFQEINAPGGTGVNTRQFSFYEPSSYAVVGNGLYFQAGLYYDEFGGKWVGNQLEFVNLTSSAETQLMGGTNDPENYGTFVSTGSNLFRDQFKNGNLTINQIDLGTGDISNGVQLFLPDAPYNGTFSNWSFSADQNLFYISAQFSNATTSSPVIYLWTIPQTEFNSGNIPDGPFPNFWFNDPGAATITTQPSQSVSLKYIEACDGNLLLNMEGSVILYNANTGNFQTIPGAMSGAQILDDATNPEPTSTLLQSSSSPPPSSSPTPQSSSSPHPSLTPPLAPINIIIGAIAAVVIAATLVFLTLRRRLKTKTATPLPPPPPSPTNSVSRALKKRRTRREMLSRHSEQNIIYYLRQI